MRQQLQINRLEEEVRIVSAALDATKISDCPISAVLDLAFAVGSPTLHELARTQSVYRLIKISHLTSQSLR